MRVVLDIEADELLDNVTKIHCLCYRDIDTNETKSITDYQEMINLLTKVSLMCGHNIIRYDVPVLEKILGIKIDCTQWDTLGLSWYLYPTRLKHGLEEWGEEFGIPKPVIKDWKNQPIENYIHRCNEDVRINSMLLDKQIDYLQRIYVNQDWTRVVNYISFKLDCAREQEEVKWRLDTIKCKEGLESLTKDADSRFEKLVEVMPNVVKYKNMFKPKVILNKKGEYTEAGKRWIALLANNNLPLDYNGSIKVEGKTEIAKPGSFQQIKSWLYSLGWVPQTYKIVKSKKTHENKRIEQISLIDGSDICPSIKLLYDKEPNLVQLEGLFIVRHRIGLLKGFLENVDKDGFLKAEIKGLANSLRFQHKIIVNLPTVFKPYGKLIRSCLIASDDEHMLCGSDVSGLEDSTKKHYMYFYDPEYIKKMMLPGYDPHLDVAIIGGMLTEEQALAHKEKREDHGKVRKDAKQVNFSAVYGVMPPKLSMTTGWPIEKSKKLLDAYWKINWSVKQIAKDTLNKTVDNQMWLFNPVSEFWYSLRYEKDKFSVLNQGCGVYFFDTWIKFIRAAGLKLIGQQHDEVIINIHMSKKEEVRQILTKALKDTNDKLKLNVELCISIDVGLNYAQIH